MTGSGDRSCDVSESEARGGRDCRVSSVHCKQCQTVPSLTYGQEPRVLKSLQDQGYTHGSSETSIQGVGHVGDSL